MSRAWHRGETGAPGAVRAALDDPHVGAVYIIGPAGSGKSFILDRLSAGPTDAPADGDDRARADPALPLLPLRPSTGTDDVTLAQLLPVLHEAHRVPAPSRTSQPHPVVLAIDDIDQLDGSSLALLGQAIDQRRIRLLATARTRAAPYVLESLRIVGESLVVTVEPWRRVDVDEFVSRRLGGRIHTLTVARLLDFSGGNALCVTELVDVGSAGGSLRQEHGVWFSGDALRVPPVTAARVGGDLPRLGAAAREVIDTTALLGPTHLATLEGAFGTAAIEEADESGLLGVEERHGELDVTLSSRIEARVIVQGMSTTRRRRLRAIVGAAQESTHGTGPSEGGPDQERPGRPARDRRPGWQDAVTGPAARVVRALLATGPEVALELAGMIDVARLDPDQQVRFVAATGWCHLGAGALARAQECAAALRQRGTAENHAHAYQLGALLQGRCALAAGDAVAAQVPLAEAAVLREDHVCFATAESALTPLALAYTMAGKDVDAVRTLDATRAGHIAGPVGVRGSLDQLTRAEVLLEKGLHHAAAERAGAVADRCLVTGQALVAVQALHLCARARPSMPVATSLGDLADRLGFDLVRLHHRHALAAAGRDAARLAEVAAAYDALGLRRLAGETAASALSLADTGRTTPWAATSRWMLHRIRLDPRVTVPASWWHEGTRSLVLTEREREIAELAASGSSSPEIAGRLQLSRRTVENHLQHVYRKLGIARRDQLGAALRRPGTVGAQDSRDGGGSS